LFGSLASYNLLPFVHVPTQRGLVPSFVFLS
jgi:hypothetical protein